MHKKIFLYGLFLTVTDVAMPIIIHGFELNMFGFLLKDLIGARLSSNVLTAFRKYSLEHLGQGYKKVFSN